jgi:hypothetical protein
VIEVVRQTWGLSPHFTLENYPVLFGGMLVQAHWQRGELGLALDCAEEAFDRARALGLVKTLADCISMALDVYTFIGDDAGAARLIGSLDGRSLDGYDFIRVKLSFNLVLHALHRCDPGHARALLCHAWLALAEGDASGALQWLAPLRDDELHVETRALSCAVRLAADIALGQPDADAIARADAELASGRLPVPAALQLRRVRQQVALAKGDSETAEHLGADIAASVRMLASSLHERPQQQAQFLSAWT